MNNLFNRIVNKFCYEFYKLLHIYFISKAKIFPMHVLERIGNKYCSWIVPTSYLNESSICYCVGVGEDISFDIGIIDKFKCSVFDFDPTPRAIAYVEKHYKDYPKFSFAPLGLWYKNEVLKFYSPSNKEHVSHSVLNLQKTNEYFEAPCERLITIMKNNNNKKLDLLKIYIEGAEYKVIDSIIEDNLDITIICIEYDETFNSIDSYWKLRITESINKLLGNGYKLVAMSNKGDYTFLKV